MDVQRASDAAFIYMNDVLDGDRERLEPIAQETRLHLDAVEVRDAMPLENQTGAVVFETEERLGNIRMPIWRQRDQKIQTEFVDYIPITKEILHDPQWPLDANACAGLLDHLALQRRLGCFTDLDAATRQGPESVGLSSM